MLFAFAVKTTGLYLYLMASSPLIHSYINQFKVLYEGEAWFGESYVEKLKGISDAQAFLQQNEMKSIAQLVDHCLYWRLPLIKRLQGNFDYRNSTDDEANWKTNDNLKNIGWQNIKEEFADSQRQILVLLEKINQENLKEEYTEGYSIQSLIEGVIHHDIYHLGQIGMIKSRL